jgi:hypothetical protein
VGNACAIGSCNRGFANCDNNLANGCETNTHQQPRELRRLRRHLRRNAICFGGVCTSVCSTPAIICGATTCVNPETDINNCGGCGVRCPATPANALSSCTSSACAITCNRGFANCDASLSNGCET